MANVPVVTPVTVNTLPNTVAVPVNVETKLVAVNEKTQEAVVKFNPAIIVAVLRLYVPVLPLPDEVGTEKVFNVVYEFELS